MEAEILKYIFTNWPFALIGLMFAYIAWNVRGFRDRFEFVEEMQVIHGGKLDGLRTDVDKIKGKVGINGA